MGAVVVKTGQMGAMLFDSRSGQETVVPAFEAEREGAGSGAGDSFNAGFLFAYSRGESLEESARFAAATAALVAGAPRGVLDAPGEMDVREFLAKHMREGG